MEENKIFEDLHTDSEGDFKDFDEDSTTKSELDLEFKSKYHVISEDKVSPKKTYVLCLGKTKESKRISAGLSDGTVHILDISSSGLTRYKEINNKNMIEDISVCGIKFANENPDLLFIGYTSGDIVLYDMRTLKEEVKFEDSSSISKRPIICFDINCNDRIICSGTCQIYPDVLLSFFDIRNKCLLGGYIESHHDDIMDIKFHSTNPDILCSGSIDNLINIFDISQPSEEEALRNTINTENSVHKLNWHKDVYGRDILSCLTQSNDLRMYKVRNGSCVADFNRFSIASATKRILPTECDLVNCHNMSDDSINLLACSNSKKGFLRSLKILNRTLMPLANFEGNSQVVRDSIYLEKENLLITGGESGIISLWSSEKSTPTPHMQDKMSTITKSSRVKPY